MARHFEFEEALIEIDDDEDYDEERLVGTAPIGDEIFVLVHALRDGIVRVISLRRATRQEIKKYVQYLETGY